MRKLMISLCALAMIAAVSGCSSKPEGEGQTEGQRTLTVSTWGLSEDVLVEDVYGPFEELCNCKVILETDTTANRYTKLSTNPDSTVDVIELSQAAAANGYVADLFEKIDTTQIPNLDNIIEGAKSKSLRDTVRLIRSTASASFMIRKLSALKLPAGLICGSRNWPASCRFQSCRRPLARRWFTWLPTTRASISQRMTGQRRLKR